MIIMIIIIIMIKMVTIRKGLELDWLCPSVLLYLVAVCPPIWILELKMADIRQVLFISIINFIMVRLSGYSSWKWQIKDNNNFWMTVSDVHVLSGERGCVYTTSLLRGRLDGVRNQPRGFIFFLSWCRSRFSFFITFYFFAFQNLKYK